MSSYQVPEKIKSMNRLAGSSSESRTVSGVLALTVGGMGILLLSAALDPNFTNAPDPSQALPTGLFLVLGSIFSSLGLIAASYSAIASFHTHKHKDTVAEASKDLQAHLTEEHDVELKLNSCRALLFGYELQFYNSDSRYKHMSLNHDTGKFSSWETVAIR